MSKPDKEAQVTTSQRLIELTQQALDTIADCMVNARRAEDRLRAAALVLQRTAPTAGPGILIVNQNGNVDSEVPASTIIRERLNKLRAAHDAREQLELEQSDGIIDAILIDGPAEPLRASESDQGTDGGDSDVRAAAADTGPSSASQVIAGRLERLRNVSGL